MESNSDAYKRAQHIIRLTACHRPQHLKLKALAYIEAFILAHEALLVAGQANIQEVSASGCPDCNAELPGMLASFAQIGSDIGTLQTIHDALVAVDGQFTRASAEFFNAAAAELESLATAADTSSARARLERLVQNTDTPE